MSGAIATVEHPGARNVLEQAWARASARVTAETLHDELAGFESVLDRHPQVTEAERNRIARALANVRSVG